MDESNLKFNRQNAYSSGYWQYSGLKFKPNTPKYIQQGKADSATISQYLEVTRGVSKARSFWELCTNLRDEGICVHEANTITKREYLLKRKYIFKEQNVRLNLSWYQRLLRFLRLS